MATVRTAPTVPAGIVPNATSIGRSLRERSNRPRTSSSSTPMPLAIRAMGARQDAGMNPGVMISGSKSRGLAEAETVDHGRGHRVVVVERHLGRPDRADGARLRRCDEGELVGCEAGEDAGCVQGGTTLGSRLRQPLPRLGVVHGREHEPCGGRRHDVDARGEHAFVVGYRTRVALGSTRRVDDAVRLQVDQRLRIVGRGQSEGRPPCELARITSDLLGGVDPHADELHVRSS